MDPADIRLLRLYNQGILQPARVDPARVVEHMAAMQAQTYPMAKWAVGLRCPGAADADIDAAVDRGEILRTHLLRPTWHFVSPKDIHALLRLTAPHVQRVNASIYRRERLDEDLRVKTRAVLEKALRERTPQTRAELAGALLRAGVEAAGIRLAYILMDAELAGVVCSGPNRGKQNTYVLLEETVPTPPETPRDEVLLAFAARYFDSRGPATVEDFAAWSGLPMRDARVGAASLPARFVREDGYHLPQPPSRIEINGRATFLMPDYDEYGMGYRDREALAPRRAPETPPSIYSHWLAVGGRIEGTWTADAKNPARAEARTYWPPTEPESREITDAIERYRGFVSG